MGYEYQTAYYGKLKSLAGIESNGWRGLLIEMNDEVVTAGGSRIILPANPRRLWAVIQNTTNDPGNTAIYFGNTSGGAILLPQYSVVQLDQNLPFTGAVIGLAGGAQNITYKVVECTIL